MAPIHEALGLAGGSLHPLPASSLVRREPEAVRRLNDLAQLSRSTLSSSGVTSSVSKVKLASILDLQGEHQEALALIQQALKESPGLQPGVAGAARLLRTLVHRHGTFAAHRALRLAAHPPNPLKSSVEVVDAKSADLRLIRDKFVLPGVPCIVRGGASVPGWTPQDLQQRLGSQVVPTRRRVTSSASWAQLEFAGGKPFDLFLAEDASVVVPDSTVAQVFDWSIWQHSHDKLGLEISIPPWFPVDLYSYAQARVLPVTGSASPTLFVASGGTSSGLHVDFLQTNFWMAMCSGRKRWRLMPREDLPLLSPVYLTDLNAAFPFDLNDVEAAQVGAFQFPDELRLVRLQEGILEPGDLIFVPRGWPHQVENLETAVAVSANFIDRSNLSESLAEAEALGQVFEDPFHLAEVLRQAKASGRPEELEQEAPGGPEPLRAFKARHGEHRAPCETQRLLTRGLQATACLGLALAAFGARRTMNGRQAEGSHKE